MLLLNLHIFKMLFKQKSCAGKKKKKMSRVCFLQTSAEMFLSHSFCVWLGKLKNKSEITKWRQHKMQNNKIIRNLR